MYMPVVHANQLLTINVWYIFTVWTISLIIYGRKNWIEFHIHQQGHFAVSGLSSLHIPRRMGRPGVCNQKKQVLAQGLFAITKLLAQDSQLLAQVLPYIRRAYKSEVFSEAKGEFIDFTPISRYQFLPDQIMDRFPFYRHYAMLLL